MCYVDIPVLTVLLQNFRLLWYILYTSFFVTWIQTFAGWRHIVLMSLILWFPGLLRGKCDVVLFRTYFYGVVVPSGKLSSRHNTLIVYSWKTNLKKEREGGGGDKEGFMNHEHRLLISLPFSISSPLLSYFTPRGNPLAYRNRVTLNMQMSPLLGGELALGKEREKTPLLELWHYEYDASVTIVHLPFSVLTV